MNLASSVITIIGQPLRDRRDELGLTQIEAAERLGVSLRSWQEWEAGRAVPHARHRQRLLEEFFAAEAA